VFLWRNLTGTAISAAAQALAARRPPKPAVAPKAPSAKSPGR